MSPLQPEPPILAYASTISVGSAVMWREDGEGNCELIVPPPSLIWLVIVPAIMVVAASPLALIAFWGLIAIIMYRDLQNGALILPAGLAILIIYLWGRAVHWLVQTIRRGRTPFVLRIADGGFEATGAFTAESSEPETRPVTKVTLTPLSGQLFYRIGLLQISFVDDTVGPIGFSYDEGFTIDQRIFHIPWPNFDAMSPWQDVLRKALIPRAPWSDTTSPSQPT